MRSRYIVVATAAVAAAVGVVLVVSGFSKGGNTAHPQPLPSKPFSLGKSQIDSIGKPGGIKPPAKLTKPQKGSIEKCEPWRSSMAIEVPSLCIYAPIERTRVRNHTLIVPTDVHYVGWDTDTQPFDAANGSTLLAGHVDDANQGYGALYYLRDAKPGAQVIIRDQAGKPFAFYVSSVRAYSKKKLPKSVFSLSGDRRIEIVTCGGELLGPPGDRYYSDNIVVTAVPVH